MGAGIILMYGGIALFVAFIVGYSAMYTSIGKNKYLNDSNNNNRKKELLVYMISLVLGIITSILTIALVFGLLFIFFGNTLLD